MTFGNHPSSPLRVDEETSYVSADGATVTVRGVRPDFWLVTRPDMVGEITYDAGVYRTRSRIGTMSTSATVDSWQEVFTLVYP